jgi:hypothetical protein
MPLLRPLMLSIISMPLLRHYLMLLSPPLLIIHYSFLSFSFLIIIILPLRCHVLRHDHLRDSHYFMLFIFIIIDDDDIILLFYIAPCHYDTMAIIIITPLRHDARLPAAVCTAIITIIDCHYDTLIMMLMIIFRHYFTPLFIIIDYY